MIRFFVYSILYLFLGVVLLHSLGRNSFEDASISIEVLFIHAIYF